MWSCRAKRKKADQPIAVFQHNFTGDQFTDECSRPDDQFTDKRLTSSYELILVYAKFLYSVNSSSSYHVIANPRVGLSVTCIMNHVSKDSAFHSMY